MIEKNNKKNKKIKSFCYLCGNSGRQSVAFGRTDFDSESVLRYYLYQKIPNFLKPCKLITTNACALFNVYRFIHTGAGSVVYLHGGYGDTSDTNMTLSSSCAFGF